MCCTKMISVFGDTFYLEMHKFCVCFSLFGSLLKIWRLQELHCPCLSVCAVFMRVQTMVWLPAFGIFIMCAAVEACSCTSGLYGHRKYCFVAQKNSLGCAVSWQCPTGVCVCAVEEKKEEKKKEESEESDEDMGFGEWWCLTVIKTEKRYLAVLD